jgi:electron transfer flavoprotein beta subunit
MHIVVCVKMVPDTTQVKIDPETNTLVREGVPFITNPFDTHAVEESLRLKDRYGAHVTAISMGPPAAETVLRRALALGVDDVILLSDRAFGGADTWATSRVLAQAIQELDKKRLVDLVICGKQTIDGDTAQVGPGIATRLKLSQLTLVDRVMEIDGKKRTVQAERKLEEYFEIVESTLPALITVVREINLPRYPTVPGRLEAEETAVPVWSNSTLNLDPKMIGLQGSPTQVKRIFAPQREKGEIVPGEGPDCERAVKAAIDRLISWGFVSTGS